MTVKVSTTGFPSQQITFPCPTPSSRDCILECIDAREAQYLDHLLFGIGQYWLGLCYIQQYRDDLDMKMSFIVSQSSIDQSYIGSGKMPPGIYIKSGLSKVVVPQEEDI